MNNPTKILMACLLVLGLSLSSPSVLISQTVTATLTGNVSDQSGAVVPKAKVVATHQGTKIDYSAESNDSGIYTIPFLPIGEYVVTAELSGFKKLVT
ncbi:MAG TPA: carboxypeptidase-like regulatory domain-containing protein, partial [Terriglobia bacterium]|nr:carboxypeptidase-like regulatory domain-containing protein [Terriglobia bacterium]